MKFSELLINAIQQSEIPLRFEPGAEEAVAKPVTDFLKIWLLVERDPENLIQQLLAELDDANPVPGT